MAMDEETRRARVAAVVIIAVAVVWLSLQWLGKGMGWTPRTMAFFDLAALAGFAWALVNVCRIWLSRRNSGD